MKRFFFIILSLVCLLPAWSQVGSYRNDFSVGFNGGYALNSISFMPKVQQSQHGGMTFGITGRYTCEKYFSSICAVQAELNVTQLGWKENILSADEEPCLLDNGEPAAYSRTITYIQLPFLAQLGWGREVNGMKFFLNMGPQFGYMLSESTSRNFMVSGEDANLPTAFSTTPDRVSSVVAQDTMAVENSFDYGITAGIGVELSMGRLGHAMVEARYYYGLGNIYGDSKRDYFARSNHGSIILKATYLFDIIRTKNAKRK